MGFSGMEASPGYQTPAAMGISQVGWFDARPVVSALFCWESGALAQAGEIPARTTTKSHDKKIRIYFIM
jgi:hypothetical protein